MLDNSAAPLGDLHPILPPQSLVAGKRPCTSANSELVSSSHHPFEASERKSLKLHGHEMKSSYDGEFRNTCSTHMLDAWERKSLKLQEHEFWRQYKKIETGYSRRLEIWKALEKLKNKSHTS